MAAEERSGAATRATARRFAARGVRRLRHGRPKLSIVVLAAGGNPGRLRETLGSVRDQASPEIEIVVVGYDGGLPVARDLAGDDTRTRFFGAASVAAARSLGVNRASGSLVLVASPGDVYLPGALADLVPALGTDEAVLLVSRIAAPGPADLSTDPGAAGAPYLGRLVVPRSRARAATGIGDDDADGFLTALSVLRDGFTVGPWPTYRSTREARPAPFRPVPNPLPELESHCARDRATLQALTDLPSARSARARGALLGLRPFLEVAEAATETQWRLLVEHALACRDLADGSDLDGDVVSRAMALLAAADQRDAVLRLVTARVRDDFATEVRDGRVIADLGVAAGLLTDDDLEVSSLQSELVAQARRLRVDGPILRLELLVGVRHLDQAPTDIVRAELLGPAGPVPFRVSLTSDPAVDLWMGESEHDHAAGLVSLELATADLPDAPCPIALVWSDGELERHAVVTAVAANGSAARRPVPLDADRAVGLHLRHGRVALAVTGSAEEPAASVTRVEVDGDVLRLTVAREITAVWLEREGRRVPGVPGAPGFWTVPLVADPWGLGAAPLPSGIYRLVLEAGDRSVPARAGRDLMDELPAERRTDLHRVRVLRRGGDGVVVRLDPLLADDEAGARAQRLLQREFLLHERPDERLVYFQSFTGQWPGDHPLAIQAELARRVRESGAAVDIRWLVADSSVSAPAGSTPVLFRSREWYDVLARASYLVTNIELERWFTRRPGQQILQTFHGYPSKAMGLGLWEAREWLPSQIETQLDHTSRTWNALLTPDPEMDQYYRRDYAYDGRILALGYPRNDELVGPALAELRSRSRARLGIAEHQRAVLYAPTWRDDLATNYRAAAAVHHLDLEATAAALGENYVLLLRGHRFHAATTGSGSRVLDVTGYPEINHLIAAADAAVLDYSSLRFDFALTGRPMVFLVPDLETYGSSTRGFLWDYRETAPGPLLAGTDEVVAALSDLDALEQRWAPDLAAFNARYNRLQDGHAAERVVAEFFGPLLG